jgi:hypothetical protein
LLTVNGFLSLSITALTLARVSHYSLAIMAQGTLLLGWIIIQVLLLRFTFVLHFVMGAAGLLLIAIGYYLFRYNKRKDLLLNSTGF